MSLSYPYKSHSVASVSTEQIERCCAPASGCWRKLQIKVITNLTSLKLIKNWNDEDCFVWQALKRDWVKNKIQSYISEDSGIAGFNVRRILEIIHFWIFSTLFRWENLSSDREGEWLLNVKVRDGNEFSLRGSL